jgi:hypothetical protein
MIGDESFVAALRAAVVPPALSADAHFAKLRLNQSHGPSG